MPVLLAFLGASIALTIAPGPDNLFVLTQGMARGRRTALATAWGMCSGIIVHVAAAIIGVSAIVASSEVAFSGIKYAGAAYLLFLSYKTFRQKGTRFEDCQKGEELPFWTSYKRGVMMNVLNPKVALFFLAFLPQFISEIAGVAWLQMILLGLVFMIQGVLLFSALALFSARIGRLLRRRPGLARGLAFSSGIVLATMAIHLAFQTR